MERTFCPVTGRTNYSESTDAAGSIIGVSPAITIITDPGEHAEEAIETAFNTHVARSFWNLKRGLQPHDGNGLEAHHDLSDDEKKAFYDKATMHLARNNPKMLVSESATGGTE